VTAAALAAALRMASPACATAIETLAARGVGGVDLVGRAATCVDVSARARAAGVEPALAVALAWHESRLDAGARNSRTGAAGALQVLPRWHCPGRRPRGCDLTGAGLAAIADFTERFGAGGGLAAYVCGPVRRRGRRCVAYAERVQRTARWLARVKDGGWRW